MLFDEVANDEIFLDQPVGYCQGQGAIGARAQLNQKVCPFCAETIKAALRTESQEDNGFIEDALDRMNNTNRPANQRLPRSMVYGTFRWAREKPRRKFQYFKWGLTERAKKIGVKL